MAIMRLRAMAWLVLSSGTGGSECRLVSGPNGVCAAVRLEFVDRPLRVGTTVRIRVHGLECSGTGCLDCAGHQRRLQWRSGSPEVATVDSTGLIRAVHPGVVEIRLEVDDSTEAATARMTVVP
jgi:hypothetical protein